MIGQQPAADFDPMIQPSATSATILPAAVDVFDFHGFSFSYLPSFISQSSFRLASMRHLLVEAPKTARTSKTQNSCHSRRPTNPADRPPTRRDSGSKQDTPV
jgi:hypothetical protein